MLDGLDIQPHDLVLDIGAGLGYSAAVIAQMAEAVVALEEEDLAAQAEAALAQAGADNVAVVAGKLAEGSAKHGPYDAIILEGGVETVPQAIADQLKEGGRIAAIFMEGVLGTARIGYKIDGVINWRDMFNGAAPLLPGFALQREFVL
jgi:protein-L-isoaspartate(D-aspartate) O-methyltransferase